MADNKEIIINSIKKLRALKLSDEEIINNLVDAGIDEAYARSLLEEVKHSTKEKIKEKKDNIKDSLGVWQEGIVTLINQKLEEIEEKEQKIESIIEKKARDIVDREMEKLKVVLDSQRTLLVNKVNITLTQAVDTINKKLDEKNKEIDELLSKIEKKSNELIDNYKLLKELQSTINKEIEDFPKMKEQLKQKFEHISDEFQESYSNLLKDYEDKLKAIDSKLNNTLALVSKIAESVVKSTEKKVSDIIIRKENESKNYLDARLKEFNALKNKIISELAKLENIRQDYENKINEDISEKIKEFFPDLSSYVSKDEFDLFREQIKNYLNNIERKFSNNKKSNNKNNLKR